MNSIIISYHTNTFIHYSAQMVIVSKQMCSTLSQGHFVDYLIE